ncbi:probable RNA-binding protein 19 [Gadus macrocephalus]|uniref:probable RNA-binding protein 19 n=1 Tax=Gadus macrocephalus TaxID=80720 RepID=UPI0028CB78BF|nr:probable RNA-binding protein 19 [Gadus macrocephalus]
MSRLIVKNLPNGMKEERFRELFAAIGTLTDCTLKFTKDGKFRKFGFVGYKTEEDAVKAQQHFNRSFLDTSRVTVEMCKAFGDPSKTKAWSKHSQTAAPPAPAVVRDTDSLKKKKPSIKKLDELEEEPAFREFVLVHTKRNQVPTWANDSTPLESSRPPAKAEPRVARKPADDDDYLNFDSDQSEDEEQEEEEEEQGTGAEPAETKEALKSGLSDMEYLRSKVAPTEETMEEEEEEGGEEEEEGERTPGAQVDSAYESGDKDGLPQPAATPGGEKKRGKKAKQETEPATDFTVKLRGAPFTIKEQQIREFMTPLKPAAIRIGRNESGSRTGYIYVDLQSDAEVDKALQKTNDYMGGRYIEVFRVDGSKDSAWKKKREKEAEPNFARALKEDEEEEDVAESGRIFIRNLPYTCSEEDIKNLFTRHGPLSEVLFPIDNLTKQSKGFAFVTYMIPENAVSAMAQLDGHVFQGRMLHLLPSTLKKEKEDAAEAVGGSSFKRQRDAKSKAASNSSHNWNSLFVGTNAVADAIAEKYNTTKSQVLDHESRGSVAVRMALGETQIVQETRQFLLDNRVSLDSFSQAAAARSTTVVLVKNLPAGVTQEELEAVFAPHGSLGRLLLPPSGLTAIVEYLEPTEAKRAFMKLAYSKFQHIPLYLEWAPGGVFSAAPPTADVSTTSSAPAPQGDAAMKEKKKEEEEEEEEEEESVPGSTLFVKNLNFSTTEETLQETFAKCGKVTSCTVSKKKDKTGKMLSMGYGFVQYQKSESAQKAMRLLQHCSVDDHQLDIKISERAIRADQVTHKKKQADKKQTGTKILVRNVPFQASVREIRELFSTFGELQTVRLPKKSAGDGCHRGFGFIDFLTKQDAKKAFTALCHSTHLYGRRLVLEWADGEDAVETLRKKTAEHFHVVDKKRRRAELMEGIIESIETGGAEDQNA